MKKILTGILIALLILINFGCSTNAEIKIVKVPNIIGFKLNDAEKELSNHGLILEITDSEFNDTIPLDHIISQAPENGEEVKEGTIVRAMVSNGSLNITVPDLTGKNLEEAISILKSIGLTIGEIADKEDNSPVGTILSQHPAAGSILPPYGSIKMVASIGAFAIVPNVVGMDVKDATKLLLNEGFQIEIIEETDIAKGTKGMVLYQYPMPGLKVSRGAEIRLKISK